MLIFSSNITLEHGYLRGNKRVVVESKSNDDQDYKPSQRRTLMDLVIETICKCSEEYDDNVQLQVSRTCKNLPR